MGRHHLAAVPAPNARAVQFYVQPGDHEWLIYSRLINSGGNGVEGTESLFQDGWHSWELADRAALAMQGEFL